MTSKKSSTDSFLFTLVRELKSKFPVIILTGLFVLFAFSGVFNELSCYKEYIANQEPGMAQAVKESYKYVFYSSYESSEINMLFLTAISLVTSASLAVGIFRFMMAKNSTNVYYSLGISRSKLFSAKYLAGVIIMAVSVIVPMLICSIANAAFFGSSYELWYAFAYISLKVFGAMYYTYTVMVICMTLLGSYLETIVMGVVAVVSPTLICLTGSVFLSQLVYGSPVGSVYNMGSGTYVKAFGDHFYYGSSGNIPTFGKYLVPLNSTDVVSELFSYRLIDGEFDANGIHIAAEIYAGKNFIMPILFLVAVTLLAAFACFLHSRRKAEKAGFMGMSTVLEGYCVVVVGSYLASVIGEWVHSEVNANRTFVALTILISGLVIMAVGYTVVDLICVRSFKAFRKRLKNLGIELLIFVVIFCVFAIGISGAFSKIPDKSEIESASITVSGAALCDSSQDMLDSAWQRADFFEYGVMRLDHSLSQTTDYTSFVKGFDTDEDISAIINIHKQLIGIKNKKIANYYGTDGKDMAYPSTIRIEYALKNGKTVTRNYFAATDEVSNAMIEIMDTDHYREVCAANITPGSMGYGAYTNMYLYVSLIPADFSSRTKCADITGDVKRELIDALRLDILAGTLPLNYVAKTEMLGYIALRNDGDYTFTYDEDGNVIANLTEDKDIEFNENYITFEGECALFPFCKGMENTLKFMQKYNLMDHFESKAKPVSVSYCTYEKKSLLDRGQNESVFICGKVAYAGEPLYEDPAFYDVASSYSYDGFYAAKTGILSDNAVTVTDAAEIDELMQAFRFRYPVSQQGYYCQVEYADGTFVYGYLPADLVK